MGCVQCALGSAHTLGVEVGTGNEHAYLMHKKLPERSQGELARSMESTTQLRGALSPCACVAYRVQAARRVFRAAHPSAFHQWSQLARYSAGLT